MAIFVHTQSLTGRQWIIGHATATVNFELTENLLADIERDQNKLCKH
jgi:hypothetical protein